MKNSQDKHGQWWRSPLHAFHGKNYTQEDFFSSDQATGVMLYLATMGGRDQKEARRAAKAWREEGKFTDVHLKGVEVLIRRILRSHGISSSASSSENLTNALFKRQDGNVFFQYLKNGVTEKLKERVKEKCLSVNKDFYEKRANPGNQWAWSRAESEDAEDDSMGWDCIFMANLIDNGTSFRPLACRKN